MPQAWDIFQLIALILVIFYFHYQLDRKFDHLIKQLKTENKVLNQKLSALNQLLYSYLKNN